MMKFDIHGKSQKIGPLRHQILLSAVVNNVISIFMYYF